MRKDLNQWKSVCGKIKTIVDRRIAHFEAVDEARIPTTFELDRAPMLGEFIKDTLLFTAASIAR